MRWIKTESGTTGTATSISSGFFAFFAGAAFVLVSVSERKRVAIHPNRPNEPDLPGDDGMFEFEKRMRPDAG
jgi:hypothetical protein